jgi:hypothetical protein
MPREMNMRLMVSGYSLSVFGVYYGPQADFKAEMAPLLEKLGTPSSTSISSQGWIETLTTYAYSSLTTPLNYDVVSFPLLPKIELH